VSTGNNSLHFHDSSASRLLDTKHGTSAAYMQRYAMAYGWVAKCSGILSSEQKSDRAQSIWLLAQMPPGQGVSWHLPSAGALAGPTGNEAKFVRMNDATSFCTSTPS
jgi:hypothetical protein